MLGKAWGKECGLRTGELMCSGKNHRGARRKKLSFAISQRDAHCKRTKKWYRNFAGGGKRSEAPGVTVSQY